MSPTATTSTVAPCACSTSLAAASSAAPQPARPVAVVAPAAEPRAQLALLAARERGDLRRVVGALLHERERLEHRVVQVRGDLGALLRADALGALGVERAHEAHDPRREDHAERERDDERDEQHVERGADEVRRRG